MGMFNWHPGLATGIPEIDHQHRQILEQFNNFSRCMSLGESERGAEAGRILDFLQFYAQWHFQREEEFMDRYRCPAAEENKLQHAAFLKRFGALYEEWQTRGMDPALVNDTFSALAEWILNHIQGVDSRLRSSVPPPAGEAPR
jgi:hemerythrin